MAPSGKYLMGTNHMGIDMISLWYGGLRASLYVGFLPESSPP